MLQARGLVKRFGAHAAVDGVDLDVRSGKLHAIIGPNGAGKTTLFNLLAGDLRPTSGSIIFRGREVGRLDSTARSHLGIGRSFQLTNVFPRLSVFENVRLAAQSRSRTSYALWRSIGDDDDTAAKADAVLAQTELTDHRERRADELAGGDGRLLELAIVLATEPQLLLLDEPSQGLAPENARQLVRRIATLARQHTIVLVEHNMPMVMDLADEITVMNFGKILAHGTPREIRANPAVRAAYLGRAAR